jgi:hypothetical protein
MELKSRKNAKFPIKLPVSRELATETSPINTEAPANQSSHFVYPVCIVTLCAVAKFLTLCERSLGFRITSELRIHRRQPIQPMHRPAV